MTAIAETRDFFLRHTEVNEGAFRDVEAHFPLSSYVKELVVGEDGTLSIQSTLRYNRFLEGDKPTPQVIEKLLTSIVFKLNPGDSASTSQAGLVKLATLAQMQAGITVDDFGFTLIYDPNYLLSKQVPDDLLDRIDALEEEVVALDTRVTALEDEPQSQEYILPIAGAQLGGVKIDNETIQISEDGTISATINESLFKVPIGFTKITNEIGDINNTVISDISSLNNMKSVDILKKMLFPAPIVPTFIPPTVTLAITPTNLLVEVGENTVLGLTETFTSSDNSVIKLDNATTFTKDNIPFSKGSSLIFTTPSVIKVTIGYQANPNYQILLDDGTILHTTDLINYPTSSGARVISAQKTVTPVTPVWIGCLDNISNPESISVNTLVIALASKKLLQASYTSVNLLVSSYTGTYNANKKIICVSKIPLKTITYSQNMNIDVLAAGVFTIRTQQPYVLSNGVIQNMYIYYANNPYTASEVVNYVFNF